MMAVRSLSWVVHAMPDVSAEAQHAGEPPLLPPEVEGFLSDPIPNAATVRGGPGTGKTTFALSALASFPGHRVYLSSSVSRPSLYRQFPWLAELRPPEIEFLELTRWTPMASDGSGDLDQMREVLQARASDLVDLARVLSLPRALTSSLAAHAAEPQLVVVDSWEGWVENLLGGSSANLDVWTTRWILERALLDKIQRAGAHVLMIVERDERNRFDYAVDGAIALSSSEFEGRQERWLSLPKLRGVRIANSSYPFTLEGSKFRSIVPTASRPRPQLIRDDPDPGPAPGWLWPGSAAFAARFGRLPVRGTLLLEADGETPIGVTWLLTAPMVLAALRSGNRVVLRPPAGLPTEDLWRELSSSMPAAAAAPGLRFADVATGSDRVGVPPETILTGSDSSGLTDSAHRGEAIDFLRLGPAGPGLAVIFPHEEFDPGSDIHTRDLYLGLPTIARRSGASLGAVLILRSDDPHIEPARVRSSTHLVVRARRGQFFLYGVRPWTPLFVLHLPAPDAQGGSRYDLIPIV